MRKTRIVPILLFTIVLSSCGLAQYKRGSSSSSSASSASSSNSSSSGASSIFSYTPSPTDRAVDFYAINDFHGAVKEKGNQMGILNLGTYLKGKKAQGNTVLINSGDGFQGSVESNYNRGALLADCWNDIKFDCFTLGNHEFDWGQDPIKENKARASTLDGYKTPYLCANVYDWDPTSKAAGSTHRDDLGDLYTVRTLDNGLKVGIVGVIGSDQWASICSSFVSDITFIDPVEVIKNVSDTLRVQENCDVVVASVHAGQDTVLNTGLTDISTVSGKRYVDAVFCAHTHRLESATENGVIFTQNDDKGENISKITLKVDANGSVYTSGNLSTIATNAVKAEVNGNYDATIKSITDSYLAECATLADEVLTTFSGRFYSSDVLPMLVTDAMVEACDEAEIKIDIAMCNSARASLYSGSHTYGDLYEALPFDNTVYVMSVSGDDIINEAKYNLFTRVTKDAIVSGKTYTIAVIDYLAVHQNAYTHSYNYFPSGDFKNAKIITKSNGVPYLYRDITADYLRKRETVYSSNYSKDTWNHDASSLGTSYTE